LSAGTGCVGAADALGVAATGAVFAPGAVGTWESRVFCGANTKNKATSNATVTTKYRVFRIAGLLDCKFNVRPWP
jgi:hypothetical protein